MKLNPSAVLRGAVKGGQGHSPTARGVVRHPQQSSGPRCDTAPSTQPEDPRREKEEQRRNARAPRIAEELVERGDEEDGEDDESEECEDDGDDHVPHPAKCKLERAPYRADDRAHECRGARLRAFDLNAQSADEFDDRRDDGRGVDQPVVYRPHPRARRRPRGVPAET